MYIEILARVLLEGKFQMQQKEQTNQPIALIDELETWLFGQYGGEGGELTKMNIANISMLHLDSLHDMDLFSYLLYCIHRASSSSIPINLICRFHATVNWTGPIRQFLLNTN